MRFGAELYAGPGAREARTLEAPDRAQALAQLDAGERERLLGLREEAAGDGLAALASLLARGLPLSGPLAAGAQQALTPAARAAAARGEPLGQVLAAEGAPAALLEALAASDGALAAELVRLAAGWTARLEGARRRAAARLIYPLGLVALACAALGAVLQVPAAGASGVLRPWVEGALAPCLAAGLALLLGGGVWLRARWGKPGPRSLAAVALKLQALGAFARAELDLERGWVALWEGATPSGDPVADLTHVGGLSPAEARALAHCQGLGPQGFGDELHALGEVRLRSAERELAQRAWSWTVASYTLAAAVLLAGGFGYGAYLRRALGLFEELVF